MRNSKNSIISSSTFAISFLCGILSFAMLFAEPIRSIAASQLLSSFFLLLVLLNIGAYITGWICLIKVLRHKEPLKVIPIIVSVFSLINLMYIYLGIGGAFELLSYS